MPILNKILIIDDDIVSRMSMKHSLNKFFDVLEASNVTTGLETLKSIKNIAVVIITLDIRDCHPLLRIIKNRWPEIQVIIQNDISYADDPIKKTHQTHCLRDGAFAVIPKIKLKQEAIKINYDAIMENYDVVAFHSHINSAFIEYMNQKKIQDLKKTVYAKLIY